MLYPKTFADVRRWASLNNRPLSEARIRFAQYVVLWAVAGSEYLRTTIVFKGGNALDFLWLPNRSTRDLDFSADMALYDPATDETVLRSLLALTLPSAEREFEVALAVQRLEQQPPGERRTFITYHCTIGYALPDDPRSRAKIRQGEPSPNVVPLEISLNESICADTELAIDPRHRLRVSTLEDFVAEKLRALLQQQEHIRNRSRPQDLLDIAVLMREQTDLDLGLVATFLLTKASARDIPVSREAFRRAEIAIRARRDYDLLATTTRNVFVPFEEAIELLLGLIDQLDIPEQEAV